MRRTFPQACSLAQSGIGDCAAPSAAADGSMGLYADESLTIGWDSEQSPRFMDDCSGPRLCWETMSSTRGAPARESLPAARSAPVPAVIRGGQV